MKVNDNVAYATLPKELRGRRNVVVSQPRTKGRFRSGKTRGEVSPDRLRGCCVTDHLSPEAEPETPTHEYDPDEVPKVFRKVEIEYSKFGVEDFDFAYVSY